MAKFRAKDKAANLDHPNILPVYEVGDHDGSPSTSPSHARRRTTVGPYIELSVPALSRFFFLILAAFGPTLLDLAPDDEEVLPFAACLGVYFSVRGVLAWVAVIRSWAWLLLHGSLPGIGACVGVVAATIWAIILDAARAG